MNNIWIFGYGSLIWNPGFPYEEKEMATIYGYKREYCILTNRHRGNNAQKGIVLGLKENEHSLCQGKAFRIKNDSKNDVFDYLEHRENGEENNVYQNKKISIWLDESKQWEKAHVFIANKKHPAFTDSLTIENKIEIILKAKGHSGTNLDYFLNTFSSLSQLNIEDKYLKELYEKLTFSI